MEETIITQLNDLKESIKRKDIPMLIHMIDEMGFEKNGKSNVYKYTRTLLIDFIAKHLKNNHIQQLRVERRGVYGDATFDVYVLHKEELYRNGHKTTWDNVGKLYAAYKQINNK